MVKDNFDINAQLTKRDEIEDILSIFHSIQHPLENFFTIQLGTSDDLNARAEYMKRSDILHGFLERPVAGWSVDEKSMFRDIDSTLKIIDHKVEDCTSLNYPIVPERIKHEIRGLIGHIEKTLENLKTKSSAVDTSLPSTETKATPPSDDVLTIKKFINQYLDYVRTNKAPKTYDAYSYSLELFQNHVGDKPLSDLVPRDLESFKETRKESVAATTVNMDIRAVKAAMTTAVDWKFLEINPFANVKQIRIPKKEPIYLRRQEFELVCQNIKSQKYKDIVTFAVYTGLRPGELSNLLWEDVDLEKRKFRVQSTDEYRVKHGQMRWVPLNNAALQILKNQSQESKYVFPNQKGEMLDFDYVSRRFKEAVRKAKLSEDIQFRHTRSTFASWAISNGMPVYALKQIMGHSSVTTTEVYAKFDEDNLLKEIDKVTPIGDADSVDVDILEDVLADDDA
jgi:integrase